MLENGHGLFDHMVHVGARHVGFLFRDHALDPPGVQVDEIAGAAAEIGQMLDSQAQAARAGRPDHQPVAAGREVGVGKLGREFLIVRLVIVPADALLGHAGGAPGFKDVEGAAAKFSGNPDFRLQVAKPFILEVREALQAAKAFDFRGGIPAGLFRPVQPERAACLRGEMPADNFAHMGVELVRGGLEGDWVRVGHGARWR